VTETATAADFATAAVSHDRAEVLGCKIDRLDMEQTVDRCGELINGEGFAQHVAINTAKLVALQRDRRLRDIVDECKLVSADGQGVVWASRLLGDPLPARVAGIDLMHRLLALAEDRQHPVFILGARRQVLERAVRRLLEKHPRLIIAGYRDGYFRDDETPDVCAEIRGSHADILFVAMGSPQKEQFLGNHGASLGVPFAMGVGGAIDVVAGVTRRAPRLMQRLGLEWLFRLLQEPRRLASRYFATNSKLLLLLGRELLGRTVIGRGRRAAR
jgi:N-acetylglucosaminyldiphosphoundecaprenol N-acetyl-beta-D-mannosaminyltransferase